MIISKSVDRMAERDDWGRDPSVRLMRRVFHEMEKAQWTLLEELGISPRDPRLRIWRHPARMLFEKAWIEADRVGIKVTDAGAGSIYTYCLANRMMRDGVEVPETLLSLEPEIANVLRKVVP